jgi:hypothetical protein
VQTFKDDELECFQRDAVVLLVDISGMHFQLDIGFRV